MNSKELKNASEWIKLYESQIDERLPKAEKGDRQSALNLLSVAAGLMRANIQLPQKLAEWIALGLHGISSGMTAEESFGFQGRKRGERSAETNVRISNDRYRRAFLVELFKVSEEITIEEACKRVAEIECTSEDTVNAAWDLEKINARKALSVSMGWEYWVTEIK